MKNLSKYLDAIKEKTAKKIDCNYEIEQLIKVFDKKLAIMASAYKNVAGTTQDDFIQEGRIAIWKAALSYDASKNASFETFVDHCIKNAMLDLVRKQTSSSNSIINNAFDIDDIKIDKLESTKELCIEDIIISTEVVAQMKESLTEDEKKVLEYRMEGLSLSDISQTLNKSYKTVSNISYNVRKKLKDYISKNSL